MLSLKKNSDFKNVYKKRKSKADKRFILYVAENSENCNRLGVSVSKKVGNSVVRHRIKRLVKESFRLNENRLITGYDIVVVARPSAKDSTYKEIRGSLIYLLAISGIKENQIEESKDRKKNSNIRN